MVARKKQGPHGPASLTPSEVRRAIIERFISRWRKEVGDDIFPAFRLIVPEKDRDRAMYGIKEKSIGKLLVQLLKIDKNSEDGYNLLNWKLPGQKSASSMAGDFAGRCYEVLKKRALQSSVGDMTIAEVNEALDRLSMAGKEEHQMPIMATFYERMNAEELMWLIRMILRQMKVGATERTILNIWHPDAETLFNVSSSLRRVCWELYNPAVRLEGDDTDITLMQCFQPQLAQFQMRTFDFVIKKLRPDENDPVFWIEEKLDGERMQLHMEEDSTKPGGKRFGFWSRKAKDYTYLYGDGLQDSNSALSRHLQFAFHENVRNIILDGEMITWDPELDQIVPFGTLKTAALAEQKNPFSTGQRPLFRVFDILYLNDEALTKYTMRDRRRALEASVKSVHRRMEIHPFTEGKTGADIEVLLRKVVADSSEGLVIKNPRSMYKLNERNDDWIKVKPEYMTEYGEALDCVVIGGYYGSGRRGGNISSFLCGLRVDETHVRHGANPMKCYSFFKVGGGFAASDYAGIRHHTDGKWKDWDTKKPPLEYVELAGGDRQHERPDVWIRPDESVVLSVKAAQVAVTDLFRVNFTLRFPRFKKLRMDKDWKSALSISDFIALKANVEEEQKEKKFIVDDARRKRARTTRKKELTVAGVGDGKTATSSFPNPDQIVAGTADLFAGLTFFVITDAAKPIKRTKLELQNLLSSHGARITQQQADGVICIGDLRVTRVASITKSASHSIIRPSWIMDSIAQAERDVVLDRSPSLLPFEPRHCFSTIDDDADLVADQVDVYGDSYACDIMSAQHMRELLAAVPKVQDEDNTHQDQHALIKNELGLDESRTNMFHDLMIYFCRDDGKTEPPIGSALAVAANMIHFGGGASVSEANLEGITHVVVVGAVNEPKAIKSRFLGRPRLPRIVNVEWVHESWSAGTLLDEERFAVS